MFDKKVTYVFPFVPTIVEFFFKCKRHRIEKQKTTRIAKNMFVQLCINVFNLCIKTAQQIEHTSNLDFQLMQLPRWEGRRWNSKVERSAETVLLNNVSTRKRNKSAKSEPAAQLLGNETHA